MDLGKGTSSSNEMLGQMISITTGALIISYSLYTFFVENYFMMLTIPVIYGLFRYLFLVHSRNYGGEPEMLFKDKGMCGFVEDFGCGSTLY